MRKLSGQLIEEEIISDWGAYEDMLRKKIGKPTMAEDLLAQPFEGLLSGLPTSEASDRAMSDYFAGEISAVDAMEQRIRSAVPNEVVNVNASPASLADVEADYRDDYGIPQTRPITKDYWNEETGKWDTKTEDVLNPINSVLLQTKGFDHRALGGADTPKTTSAAKELIDKHIMHVGLD